jgi:hypothetical protein
MTIAMLLRNTVNGCQRTAAQAAAQSEIARAAGAESK